MANKYVNVGILALIIALTAVTITLNSQVRIKVEKTKSTFYINDSVFWRVTGVEYLQMYDGKTLMKFNSSLSGVKTEINGNLVTVKRTSVFNGGVIVYDTYHFDSTISDVKMFPITHDVRVVNGEGKILQYKVTNLGTNLTPSLNATSPQRFGDMKIEYPNDYISSILTKTGTLTVRYQVLSFDETRQIRLFDPSPSYYLDANAAGTSTTCTSLLPCKSLQNLTDLVTLAAGDTVYFDSCDIFRGKYVFDDASGTAGSPISFTTNGTCARQARIWGSFNYSKSTDWTSLGSNKYESTKGDLTNTANVFFYGTNNYANGVGYPSLGTKKACTALTTNYDYCYNSSGQNMVLYLSTGNPGTVAGGIEVPNYEDTGTSIFRVSQKNFVNVRNLSFSFANELGFTAFLTSNVNFTDNTMEYVYQKGLYIDADRTTNYKNNYVNRNTFRECGLRMLNSYGLEGRQGECIFFNKHTGVFVDQNKIYNGYGVTINFVNVTNYIISYNWINGSSIDDSVPSGIYPEGSSDGLIIGNNVSKIYTSGINLVIEDASKLVTNVTVVNNTFISATNFINTNSIAGKKINNITIIQNTFIQPDCKTYLNNSRLYYIDHYANLTIKNNIFYSGGNTSCMMYYINMTSGKLDSNNNLFYSPNGADRWGRIGSTTLTPLSQWQSTTGNDSSSVSSDPLFVDYNGGDYRLGGSSPGCTISTTGSYVGVYPCLTSPSVGWKDTGFSKRRNITILSPGTLTNYPMDLFINKTTDMQTNMSDVVFYSGNNQMIKRKINYTSTIGYYVVMLNLTNGYNTIEMYYGNTTYPWIDQDPFQDSNYVSVYMLNNVSDLKNRFTGTLSSPIAPTFNGFNITFTNFTFMSIGDNDEINSTKFWTIEAWVYKISNCTVESDLLIKEGAFALADGLPTNLWRLQERSASSAQALSGNNMCFQNSWSFVSVTNSSSGITFMVNGNSTTADNTVNFTSNNAILNISRASQTSFFNGSVSRLTISKTNRNLDWNNLTYLSRASPQTILSYTTEENQITNNPPTLSAQTPENNTLLVQTSPTLTATVVDLDVQAISVNFTNSSNGKQLCYNTTTTGNTVNCQVTLGANKALRWNITINDSTSFVRYGVYNLSTSFPVTTSILLENSPNQREYELGSAVVIRYNSSDSSSICLDIIHPRYRYNYACDTGTETVSFPEVYNLMFNDSNTSKVLAYSGNVTSIMTSNQSDIQNLSFNLTTSGFVENVKVDVNNDGILDYYVPGKVLSDKLEIMRFSNNLTNETFAYTGSGQSYLRYLIMPDLDLSYGLRLQVNAPKYTGDLVLNATETVYKDLANTNHEWNTTESKIRMYKTIGSYTYDFVEYYNAGSFDAHVNDDIPGMAYIDFGTANNIYDDNDATATVQFTGLEHAVYGLGLSNITLSLNNISSDMTLKFKYYFDCERSCGGSIRLYNWSTLTYDLIYSNVAYGTILDTGIVTLTIPSAYKNSTNSIKLLSEHSSSTVSSLNDNFQWTYLYTLSGQPTNAYETRPAAYLNTTTLTLTTSPVWITNVTVLVNTSNATTDNVKVYLSSDSGVNWKLVDYLDQQVKVNFTINGTVLKAKFELGTNNKDVTSFIRYIRLVSLVDSYATNISFDFGNDGFYDWKNTTVMNETVREYYITNHTFSTYRRIYCDTPSYTDYCLFPIRMKVDSAGYVNISKINMSSDILTGNFIVNSTPINCTTASCEVKLNFTWDNGNNLYVAPYLAYYGQGNVTVYARTSDITINTTVVMWYSNFNQSLPYKVSYLEFIPRSPTSKNVTPYGQTNLVAIYNLTMLNKGQKNMNISVMVNESNCVNFTVSSTNNKSQGTLLGSPNQWYTIFSNKEYNNKSRVWMWADYNCTPGWDVWTPDILFKGCAFNTTCNDELGVN